MQNKLSETFKKSIAALTMGTLMLGTFGLASLAQAATTWDTTGTYSVNQNYLGTDTPHTMNLTQDGSGNLSGNGNSGAYTWVIDSGSVSGNTVNFVAHYTATADASTTVLTITSLIAPNGSMSGTWSDNYPGDGSPMRTGTWTTTSGAATATTSPATVTTGPATNVTANDATLNGSNGTTAATQSSFWVSTSTFSTAAPVLPPGVYSTADLGPVAANTPYSAQLTSVLGLPTITPNTTYYVAAWANVNGTWTSGAVIPFTTSSTPGGTIGGTVTSSGTLAVTSITSVDTIATADNSYADGWTYVYHITLPTNETHVSMKFTDWTAGSSTMATAGNMRISSAQADNAGATITVAAANTYTTPALHMTTDLDPATPGIQVDVTVEVKVPVGTANASYSTTYSVQSL